MHDPGTDVDPTLFGEFDRVIQQVEQNLSQACSIAPKPIRDLGDVGVEMQFLRLNSGGGNGADLVDDPWK